MRSLKNNEFVVTYTVEVEGEDSMEVGDYKFENSGSQVYADVCEEADPSQFLPLNEDGIVIAPEPGVYNYLCIVDPDTEETEVLDSRPLTESEVNTFYGEINFPDAEL